MGSFLPPWLVLPLSERLLKVGYFIFSCLFDWYVLPSCQSLHCWGVFLLSRHSYCFFFSICSIGCIVAVLICSIDKVSLLNWRVLLLSTNVALSIQDRDVQLTSAYLCSDVAYLMIPSNDICKGEKGVYKVEDLRWDVDRRNVERKRSISGSNRSVYHVSRRNQHRSILPNPMNFYMGIVVILLNMTDRKSGLLLEMSMWPYFSCLMQ
jgi:hypothetical protein